MMSTNSASVLLDRLAAWWLRRRGLECKLPELPFYTVEGLRTYPVRPGVEIKRHQFCKLVDGYAVPLAPLSNYTLPFYVVETEQITDGTWRHTVEYGAEQQPPEDVSGYKKK